jgi:hypothetical protein
MSHLLHHGNEHWMQTIIKKMKFHPSCPLEKSRGPMRSEEQRAKSYMIPSKSSKKLGGLSPIFSTTPFETRVIWELMLENFLTKIIPLWRTKFGGQVGCLPRHLCSVHVERTRLYKTFSAIN